MAQLRNGFPLCDVAGDLGKNIPSGEGEIVRILDHVELNHLFGFLVEDEREDAVVGPDEVVAVVEYQCVGRLNRSLLDNTEDVDRSFGEIAVAVPYDEGRLGEVVG